VSRSCAAGPRSSTHGHSPSFGQMRIRRVAHQTPVVTTGPDTMPIVEEQSLRIDGANAANVASLAGAQIIDDEMIARVTHGVELPTLFIVQ
jgi:hypothetical protein